MVELARRLLDSSCMQEIDSTQLATVVGGESLGQTLTALVKSPSVPVDQQYGFIKGFIADHPFFHQGVMDAQIPGGKHFRNVPFIGPAMMYAGGVGALWTGGAYGTTLARKGWETTKATWDAA